MLFAYRNISDPLSLWDISFWIITILLSLLIALYSLFKLFKKQKDITNLQKWNVITWSISYLFLTAANILNLTWRYIISNPTLAKGADNVSVLFVNLAILTKILHTEYSINQYKFYRGYYFSIALIGLILFTLFVTPDMVRTFGIFQIIFVILLLIGISVFPGIFLYLAIKLGGKKRRRAAMILIAAICFTIGFLLQPHNLTDFVSELPNFTLIYNTFLILCPLLICAALLIIFKSYEAIL
ncbi:MAG: hypothetical protein ACOC44_09585 [Promethearchaeia archaeon]